MSQTSETKSVTDICAAHGDRPDGLIEILREIQSSKGWLADDDLKQVAQALNLSRAEVHGVVSFYHDFRRAPPGKSVVKICLAEACQAVGCNDLKEHAEQVLAVEIGQTTDDGNLTLAPVYCLGNCALGPAVMVGDQLHGRVTPERFDALLRHANS